MDDLPRPANPTIDLGGIPASQDTLRSIRQFSVIDKVECQERDIPMTLTLGIVLCQGKNEGTKKGAECALFAPPMVSKESA
jgi:hypothetical protein